MRLDVNQLWQKLASNKKQMGAMCMLVGVALLLWGRLLLKNVPRTAVADPQLAAVADPADGAGGQADGRGDRLMRPVVYLDLRSTVQRDLFRPDPVHFPRYQNVQATSVNGAKSGPDRVDEFDGRSEAEVLVRKCAQNLKLQSTLLGPKPKALINGSLVNPGDYIEGFHLLEVRSRQVTIQKDGIKVMLQM